MDDLTDLAENFKILVLYVQDCVFIMGTCGMEYLLWAIEGVRLSIN
jgi:hypothetical protein